MDSQCSGGVCDTTTLTCRSGCTGDAQCPLGQMCNVSAKTCVVGCATDATCNAGQICTAGMCVTGCRSSSSCALGSYCDTKTLVCVPGCTDASRCAVGQACTNTTVGTTQCSSACFYGDAFSGACKGTGWECMGVFANPSRCRFKCTSDAQCSNGERCTNFTVDVNDPGANVVQYCAQPCSVAGCTNAFDIVSMNGCTCGTNGACSDSRSSCYQGDPAYGLP
jgi:hypothetical protein